MSTDARDHATAAGPNRAGQDGAQPSATAPRNPASDAVLGQVVWLMMNMPQYRHVFLADLEWMVLPPILLKQYRLFRAGDHVVAFAAWAVRVPGPVPVRTMLHSSPAPNSVGQLCEAAKPVTESCRLLAATEPRLRNVMFGDESTENASDGPEESVNLAR